MVEIDKRIRFHKVLGLEHMMKMKKYSNTEYLVKSRIMITIGIVAIIVAFFQTIYNVFQGNTGTTNVGSILSDLLDPAREAKQAGSYQTFTTSNRALKNDSLSLEQSERTLPLYIPLTGAPEISANTSFPLTLPLTGAPKIIAKTSTFVGQAKQALK